MFFWMVKLALNYQHTISERYGKEITRLDAELSVERAANAELRGRIEVLENNQNELRFLRNTAQQHGIFNPWDPVPGTAGDHG